MNRLLLAIFVVGSLFFSLNVSAREFDELHVSGPCDLRVVYKADSAGMLSASSSAGNISFTYAGSSLILSLPASASAHGLIPVTLYAGRNLRVVEASGRARITIPLISSAEPVSLISSGAAAMSVDAVSASVVNVSLSGSGSVTIGNSLTATNLNFSLTGSGVVTADGITATRMTVTQRGSGKLIFSGSARDCDVVGKGTGSVDLRRLVAGKMDLKLFGGGRIFYPAGIPVTTAGNTERIIQVKPYQPL